MPASPSRVALTALAAAVLAGAAAPAAAPAVAQTPSAGPSRPAPGLYGTQDPTFDGAYRQGLALLALDAVGRRSPDALAWLTGQQCADGGWAPYRADTAAPCKAGAEDTNSTAMAVQALAATGGQGAAVDKGIRWLRGQQNADGGVGFSPGTPSDANSTALLVNALVAAGEDPAQAKGKGGTGGTPYDALAALQLGCTAKPTDRGAFAYQPDKTGALFANDNATAQATLAAAGKALPVTKGVLDSAAPQVACPASRPADPVAAARQRARDAVAYLAARLTANSGALPPLQGTTPDYGSTANAVIAMAAVGAGGDAARAAAGRLARDVDAVVKDKAGVDQAGPLATLVLAATALGQDPGSFGGTNLVDRLVATGPAAGAPEPAGTSAGAKAERSTAGVVIAVVVGALVVLLLLGLVLARRRGTAARR